MHRAAIFGKYVESNEKMKTHDAILIIPALLICYFITEFVLFNKKMQFVLNTICKIAIVMFESKRRAHAYQSFLSTKGGHAINK